MKISKIDTYEGIRTKQSTHIFQTFPVLLGQGGFSRVVEIGTYAGGLSLFISKIAPNVEYLGYEIDPNVIHPNASHLNIRTVNFAEEKEFIREYISREGRCLVLCDGGNKLYEFATLAPLIKLNDVIMTHDYLDDTKHDVSVYQSVEGFRKPETTKTMLLPIAKENNLTDECNIDFTHSLWSHWTKKED